MPHVQRSMLIPLDAAAADVARVLHDTLGLAPDRDPSADGTTSWSGPIVGMPDTESRLLAHVVPNAAGGRVREITLVARSDVVVPFFTWFLRIQGFLGARRALPHAAARLRAGLAGEAAPPPLSPWALVPPVPFTPEQAGRLGALALVALLANFAGSLLSQNGDAVTSAFGRSDQALGVALAVARAGVLLSLVAIALADRLGRRRLILVALVGACARERARRAVAHVRGVHRVAGRHPRAGEHRAHRRRHRRGGGGARRRPRLRDRHVRARARRGIRPRR